MGYGNAGGNRACLCREPKPRLAGCGAGAGLDSLLSRASSARVGLTRRKYFTECVPWIRQFAGLPWPGASIPATQNGYVKKPAPIFFHLLPETNRRLMPSDAWRPMRVICIPATLQELYLST